MPGRNAPIRIAGRSIVFPPAAVCRIDERLLKAPRHSVAVEVEPAPVAAENAARDRAAGHARDTVELREEPDLVQPPQRPRVKEHGTVAAARETESDAVLGRPIGLKDHAPGCPQAVAPRQPLTRSREQSPCELGVPRGDDVGRVQPSVAAPRDSSGDSPAPASPGDASAFRSSASARPLAASCAFSFADSSAFSARAR